MFIIIFFGIKELRGTPCTKQGGYTSKLDRFPCT